MKNNLSLYILALISLYLFIGLSPISAQDKKEDSESGNRNVMLNAADNKGPRDVNIGLPAGTGGTTILENNLPAVYFYWPELPTKAWRQDATISGVRLLDVGETAIYVGDVGFSIGTLDNLGTDKFSTRGSLNSNHFGLLRGDINFSGPIGKHGTTFSLGAYGSFDPGTFDSDITKYLADRTQLYKGAISQDYKISGLKGRVSVFYKYIKAEGIATRSTPFKYGGDGKVEELDNFRIGRDSYFERTGILYMHDAFSGEYKKRDILKDYGSDSHTVDLISKNTLDNGLNIDFTMRFRKANTGQYAPATVGISTAKENVTRYVYADNQAEVYQGKDVQNILNLASRKTPLTSVMTNFQIGKKSGSHEWTAGLHQWYMNTDNFVTESSQFAQEIAPNPRKLILQSNVGGVWTNGAPQYDANNNVTGVKNIPNEYGDLGINSNLEFYNGNETKSSIYLTDKWNVNDVLTIKGGMRLTLNQLIGDYIAKKDRQEIMGEGGILGANAPKTGINHSWWLKAFMASATYKVTDKFGVLGDFVYNEEGSHLNKYSTGSNPNIKKSKIPSASFGVFFNHDLFSVVSKATYINRDQYRTTVNFSNPKNPAQVERATTSYDIQTIGWTTDILSKPFKGFELHLLFTYQIPKYKDFTGNVDFGGGQVEKFDFSDKIVTGVPKILIEIDPSYRWNQFKVWASVRYFSKQYFNKPNTLYMEPRWETFAGVSYKISSNFDINISCTNLFNQRGANGSMPDGDLVIDPQDVAKKKGQIMSGSYIIPFTTQFGLKYRF